MHKKANIFPVSVIGFCLLAILLFTTGFSSFSQEASQDSVVVKKPVVFHSPRKATIYSAALPGLGQIYNGQIKKGIGILLIHACIWVIAVIVYVVIGLISLGVGFICGLPILLIPLVFWLWVLYDAYTIAVKINNGEPVKDWLD
jgi:TM2 domain-containing membrane protein YozV